MRRRFFLSALMAAGIMFMAAGFAVKHPAKPTEMQESFFVMNTYNTFTFYEAVPAAVTEDIKKELAELEKLWSVTENGSEISRINGADGNPVRISPQTADILRFALDIGEKTNGALDVSSYPLLTAWGFTTDTRQIPTKEVLAERLTHTGYEKIRLIGNTVQMEPGMALDLGAVAKGYACDRVMEKLRQAGVSSAIVNLGGNLGLIGAKPDGSDFKISVEHPENRDSLGLLSLSDVTVVTSGAYERYFVGEDGKRYGHILDPKTGIPAESGLSSVTVVGNNSRLCDALATAFFVMGTEETARYWREQTQGSDLKNSFELLFITETGEVLLTEGLENRFELSEAYREVPVSILRR